MTKKHVESREPLPVEDATDLLLVLLYAPGKTGRFGEPIAGSTRLQKLFFLLRQGEGPQQLVAEAERMLYQPYKMGPFSAELRDTVQDLAAAGIIVLTRLDYQLPDDTDPQDHDMLEDQFEGRSSLRRPTRTVNSYEYALSTDLGMQIGADLWSGLSSSARDGLTEFKRFFNSISLRQLLIFTYEKYPDYTTRSTIKEQLGF